MEQHAVPQHIAAFQFKLFGNLTPKQFLFVGSFGMLGFLIFVSPLPALIKFPLSLTLFAIGLVSGLVPIQGRSFDKWLIAFFRAVFSPTQRIWRREEELPLFLQPAVIGGQKVAL
ncbi:MAG TPA: PrgI family protein, partial [Patescibacteria group bacterium]